MNNENEINLLNVEQVGRLNEVRRLEKEINILEMRIRLRDKLRENYYQRRWIKPFDLWRKPFQILCGISLIWFFTLACVLVYLGGNH